MLMSKIAKVVYIQYKTLKYKTLKYKIFKYYKWLVCLKTLNYSNTLVLLTFNKI